MVPTHLILLASMPLTANGKLDRRALPAPDPELNRQDYVAPSNELEMTLAQIWCEVLNVEQVGLNDNFFELGGDSILSIQVVSRARQQGIHFSPRDLFQHQTVQTLAAVASRTEQVTAEQGLVVGESALTPIQHWFFDTEIPERQHWNQALLLEPTVTLEPHRLEQALLAVIEQHDALRLRFTEVTAQWQATHQPVSDAVSCGKCASPRWTSAKRCSPMPSAVSICNKGPLVRAVLVDGPKVNNACLSPSITWSSTACRGAFCSTICKRCIANSTPNKR
jgi:aryl carrier-like protein